MLCFSSACKGLGDAYAPPASPAHVACSTLYGTTLVAVTSNGQTENAHIVEGLKPYTWYKDIVLL